MKYFIFLFILFVCLPSRADIFGGFGAGLRFENDSESNQSKSRSPIGGFVGWSWEDTALVLDYSTFSASTGNATLKIERQNQMIVGGYRYSPFDNKTFTWYPYFTGLAGVTWETVTTQFLAQTDTRTSKKNFVFGGGVGAWGNIVSYFNAGAEFRAFYSKDFSPAVLLDLSFRVGFEF